MGLYGVTAYTVAVRTGEMGIRMALGAKPSDIVRGVLASAFSQVILGLALGVPIAIAAGRLMASQLYQVSSYDPPVLAAAIVTLGVCAFVASIIPARRAAVADPVLAMKRNSCGPFGAGSGFQNGRSASPDVRHCYRSWILRTGSERETRAIRQI